MRSTAAQLVQAFILLLIGSSSSVAAFRPPQPWSVRRSSTALFSTARQHGDAARNSRNNNLHEFDYLLQETASSSEQNKVPVSRARRIIIFGDDQRKTILISSTAAAAPTTTTTQSETMDPSSSSSSQQQQQQQEGTTTETTTIEDDYEYDPFGGEEQFRKVQQFQQKIEQKPSFGNRLKEMDLSDIMLTLFLPAIALFAAGRWGYNRVSDRVQDKTDTLLDSFASEMIYHDGDFKEMKMCADDYKRRLAYLVGPIKTDKMLKRYLETYAKRKTISPQAISSLSYVFTLFGLSEERAANILVSLCRQMGTDKISSAGKILFLGSRIIKSPEGVQALEPIKDLIKSTYREAAVADTMVETSQQAIAEASYRTTVLEAGKNQRTLTVGWEVLGLDRDTAQRIFDEEAKEGFVSYREAHYGGQTQKYDKKGRRVDEEGKPENPEEADDDDESDSDEAVSNVYECSECGYTLFVAQGRESKFFGENFKCPECGAPKDKFIALDDLDE